MRHVLRLLLLPVVVLALARAVFFILYAYESVWVPLEVHHLESQMVHLAWRAQKGLDLYPDWRHGAHVTNFFGPLYFWGVGQIGRLFGADLEGLFRIGRLVTIGSGLLAAVVVGLAARSRYGRGAGIVSAWVAIGSAPMLGFGVMARPDVAADLLGFTGFLLATARGSDRLRWPGLWLWIGGALLVAAFFTKQTTGLYLLAAAIALGFQRRRAASLGLLTGFGLVCLAIIGAATATLAPNFLDCLIAEGQTPIDPAGWRALLGRLWTLGRDLILLTSLGLILWRTPRRRDVSLATLAVVVPGLSVVAALKLGAELNYFLGLRLVAAMAVGALWAEVLGSPAEADLASRRRPWWAWLLLIVALVALSYTLLIGWISAFNYHQETRAYVRFIESPSGQTRLRAHRILCQIAADPGRAILTDSGQIALQQRERAPFVDPWLFRVLVISGRIEPEELLSKIKAQEYELIITVRDLEASTYDEDMFSLPPVLAEAARRHYELSVSVDAYPSYSLYTPRSSEKRLLESEAPPTDR
ncbi:hypothetical protein BH23PLA1_BH23PLA1_06480 [soil metagenome]